MNGWTRIAGLGFTLALMTSFVASQPALAEDDQDGGMDYNGGFVIHHTHPPFIPGYSHPAPPPVDTGRRLPSDYYYPESPASSAAQPSPYAGLWRYLPWNQAGFEGYGAESAPASFTGYRPAHKYRFADEIVRGCQEAPADRAGFALHLPAPSGIWFDGQRKGSGDRYFQTPALAAGTAYRYQVSAAWVEDGHWVAQSRTLTFAPGEVHALYLQRVRN